jgi:thiamine kinase-like enzyme
MKKKDLGRWLKAVVEPEAHLPLFDKWWSEVNNLPALPRRDAHAYNWLVTSEEQVLAVDLESTGWRPAGYELAQLTDDVPILEVSDIGWAKRMEIVDSYRTELGRNGIGVSSDELRRGYVTSLLARAVRSLSDPAGDAQLRAHGEMLLS